MKMRIGIEAQRLLKDRIHGVEVVALELINQLQLIDDINEYFIFVRDHGTNKTLELKSNFHLISFKASSFPEWEQIQLPKMVSSLGLDVLHCTANTAPIKCNTPIILTLHDIIFMKSLEFQSNLYQFFGNIYRRVLVPFCGRSARYVVTVSNYEKNQISKRLKILPERLKVVYNGVGSSFNVVEDKLVEEFKIQYKLPNEFILHFGNSAPKKNTIGAIEGYLEYAKDTVDCVPLVIAGGHFDFVEGIIKRLNLPSELNNKLVLLPYINFDQQPLLYNAATLLLYPSTNESFGLPLVEAMACGTPVITSNSTALPEIAGDAAVLVSPNDSLAMSKALADLLSEDDYYQAQVLKGKRQANFFNWHSTALEYHELYKMIV